MFDAYDDDDDTVMKSDTEPDADTSSDQNDPDYVTSAKALVANKETKNQANKNL